MNLSRRVLLGAGAGLGLFGRAVADDDAPAAEPIRIEREFRALDGGACLVAYQPLTYPQDLITAWNGYEPKRRYFLLRRGLDGLTTLGAVTSGPGPEGRFADAAPDGLGGAVFAIAHKDRVRVQADERRADIDRLPNGAAAVGEALDGGVLVLAASAGQAVYAAYDPQLRESVRAVIDLPASAGGAVINVRRLGYEGGWPAFEIRRVEPNGARLSVRVSGPPSAPMIAKVSV